ncbi:TonB dependent receptor [compost metagenome]
MSWQTQFIGKSCFDQLDPCSNYDEDGRIGLTTFSDLQVRYAVTPKATVFAGVDNIFDKYVYIGQGWGQPTGWTTQPDVYDGLGRRYVVGARVSF